MVPDVEANEVDVAAVVLNEVEAEVELVEVDIAAVLADVEVVANVVAGVYCQQVGPKTILNNIINRISIYQGSASHKSSRRRRPRQRIHQRHKQDRQWWED